MDLMLFINMVNFHTINIQINNMNKNNKLIFLLNISIIILVSLSVITVYFKDNINKNLFNNLIIIYGLAYASIIITAIILGIILIINKK